MAWIFDANTTPATGAEAIFKLKELLKSAGWTVQSSSDGTTYNASGDQITVATSGAGGMANNSAWFRIRQPGANAREFTFQRGTTNLVWRLKYSGGPSTGFVGGSPGATQTPSATDEVIQLGGGTDASPTYQANTFTTDGGYRFNAGADDSAPYGFYFWTHTASTNVITRFWMLDPMATGTFDAADVDPVVIYTEMSAANCLDTGFVNSTSTDGLRGWIRKGLSAPSGFLPVHGLTYNRSRAAAQPLVPTNGGTNPYTGKDFFMPVPYARHSGVAAPNGFKGFSTVARWMSQGRNTFDTFTVSTSKDYVALCGTVAAYVVVPWNGSDVTL